MRMYDIIEKKRNGEKLSHEEIKFFVDGITDGTIPDYQASALCMAVFFRGMDGDETSFLTDCMAKSGDMIDLSGVNGVTADKHSTGGVGDKTTLIVAPIVASAGGKIAKMSGRGLGHTGGTIDKLESIPGFKTELSESDFINQVNNIGLSVIAQTKNIAPADKVLYALRDVTATVDCLPLIASSIMSKKLASGASCIVLDVKTGSGAFMKTIEDSTALAEKMVEIGNKNGRKTLALITDMNVPLGSNVGNSLEVSEAVEVLKGGGPDDLKEVAFALAAAMISAVKGISSQDAEKIAEEKVKDGSALIKLKEMVSAQGGDSSYIDNPQKFRKAQFKREISSPQDGFIVKMDTEKIGIASSLLGAGRTRKGDKINFAAGIILNKKTSDEVRRGEVLATLFCDDADCLDCAECEYLSAISFGKEKVKRNPMVYKTIS